MNDTSTNPPNNAQTPLSNLGKAEGPIVPIAFPQSSTNPAVETAEFKLSAKSLEPAIGSIVGIIDGAAYRVILRKASKILDEENAEEVASLVRLSKESKDAAKQAGARIAARRCPNAEAVDWAVLAGVAGEWAIGFSDCLAQLKKMEKEMLSRPKVLKKDDNDE